MSKHGLKPGDLVVRTVAHNRYPRREPFKREILRVSRVTKAGYVYLHQAFGKFHGDGFPLREWWPRGESRQYVVLIEGLAPEGASL